MMLCSRINNFVQRSIPDSSHRIIQYPLKSLLIIEQGRALQEEFGARLLEHTNEAQRKAFFETMDIINENLDAILEGEA